MNNDDLYAGYYINKYDGEFFDKYKKTGIKERKRGEETGDIILRKQKTNRKKIILLLFIPILFCSYLLLFIGVYNGTGKVFSLFKSDVSEYFCVAVGDFPDNEKAYVYSNTLAIEGSCGYVYRESDKHYTIIIAPYLSEEGANTVTQKLKSEGIDAHTIRIELREPDTKKLSDEEKNFFSRISDFPNALYFQLYQMATELSNGNMNVMQIKNELQKQLIAVSSECELLSSYAATHYNNTGLELSVFSKLLYAGIANLINVNCDTGEYLSELRYTSVMIILGYGSLINAINNQ